MSWTISSDEFPILTLTWQPVVFSKSVTQSTFGSFEPSSTYPAHATRLTCPSPGPRVFKALSFGGRRPPVADVVPPLSSPPQPAATRTSAPATVANVALRDARMRSSLPMIRVVISHAVDMILPPAKHHTLATQAGELMGRRHVVLAHDDELPSDIQGDDQAAG